MKRIIIDANTVVGYLVRGEKDLLLCVDEYEEMILPDVVVFESVFVLQKLYDLSRTDICESLCRIIQLQKIQCSRLLLFNSLLRYKDSRALSFIDCYLTEMSEISGCKLITRDKNLKKKIRQ